MIEAEKPISPNQIEIIESPLFYPFYWVAKIDNDPDHLNPATNEESGEKSITVTIVDLGKKLGNGVKRAKKNFKINQ